MSLQNIPNSFPSLCIPRVFANITEVQVGKVISELHLGIIKRIDIVKKNNEKSAKYQRIFIHFKTWYPDGNAIIARERVLNGKDIKIIYKDPWYWKVTAYREPPKKNKKDLLNKKKINIKIDKEDEYKCNEYKYEEYEDNEEYDEKYDEEYDEEYDEDFDGEYEEIKDNPPSKIETIDYGEISKIIPPPRNSNNKKN